MQVLEEYTGIIRSFELKCQKISMKKLLYQFWTAMALAFSHKNISVSNSKHKIFLQSYLK